MQIAHRTLYGENEREKANHGPAEVDIRELLSDGGDHILSVEDDPEGDKGPRYHKHPFCLRANMITAPESLPVDAVDRAEGSCTVGSVVGSVSEAEEGGVEEQEVAEAIVGIGNTPFSGRIDSRLGMRGMVARELSLIRELFLL
jgi:hypothetical protein